MTWSQTRVLVAIDKLWNFYPNLTWSQTRVLIAIDKLWNFYLTVSQKRIESFSIKSRMKTGSLRHWSICLCHILHCSSYVKSDLYCINNDIFWAELLFLSWSSPSTWEIKQVWNIVSKFSLYLQLLKLCLKLISRKHR